jgi:hypothetical protein
LEPTIKKRDALAGMLILAAILQAAQVIVFAAARRPRHVC